MDFTIVVAETRARVIVGVVDVGVVVVGVVLVVVGVVVNDVGVDVLVGGIDVLVGVEVLVGVDVLVGVEVLVGVDALLCIVVFIVWLVVGAGVPEPVIINYCSRVMCKSCPRKPYNCNTSG